MQELGAHRVLPLALGDEDSLDEDFIKWSDLVHKLLTTNSSFSKSVSKICCDFFITLLKFKGLMFHLNRLYCPMQEKCI